MPMEKKMQEHTIFFIYGLISLLIQEIFAYTYIIFPIKDFGKMQRKVNLLFILSWLSPFTGNHQSAVIGPNRCIPHISKPVESGKIPNTAFTLGLSRKILDIEVLSKAL